MTEIKGVTELQRRFEAIKDQRQLLGQVTGLAKAEASKLAPVKTGNLKRSIRIGTVSNTSALIYAGAKYAPFVEFDTKPHDIRPRNKRALSFPSQKLTTERFGSGAQLKFRKSGSLTSGSMRKFGNAAYATVKRVRHPGTKAKPFLVPGAKAALEKAGYIVNIIKAWNEAA